MSPSRRSRAKFAVRRWFAPFVVLIAILAIPLLFNAWQASGQGRDSNTFAGSVQPFLAKNCYGCHNSSLKSGGLDLQSFKSAASVAESRETWEKILKKVEAGEMPPPPMPRPEEVQLRAATSWIQGEFKRLDAHVKPDPGRVTARRLNRDEYKVIAFQADLTRVSTLIYAREASPKTYPEIGVPEGHHPISHHRNDPVNLARLSKINVFHAELFSHFIAKLAATPDGDGTLLDHSMVLYGSGLSDSNRHIHENLPILVLGCGCSTGWEFTRKPWATATANWSN